MRSDTFYAAVLPVFVSVLVCIGIGFGLSTAARADSLMDARIAQNEGRYGDCATFADTARREAFNTFHAHRLYANCIVNAADEQRATLGAELYAAEVDKAVAALELLARTPGARHETKANDILEISIQQLQLKAAEARAAK